MSRAGSVIMSQHKAEGARKCTCAKMHVCGNGLVVIIEGFDIVEANLKAFETDQPVSAHNLKVHLLSDGQTYEILQKNPPHK